MRVHVLFRTLTVTAVTRQDMLQCASKAEKNTASNEQTMLDFK